MTVTINKMTAGSGYEYFLRTVAAGDGDRSLSTPLTRDYTEEGIPPGRWLGSGLSGLESQINIGDEVTEEQLRLLIGEGKHPVSGEHLGRRIPGRQEARGGQASPRGRGLRPHILDPEVGERAVGSLRRRDQAIIADAHHAAVADALSFLEREVLATRAGAKGPKGGVAQFDATGVMATAFDHYDSRANDPHLHTHVVICNRVKTTHDGAWRTIDGNPLHAWVVAISELHEAVFSDHPTRALDADWQRRPRGRDRSPAWEVRGVPQSLVDEFSGRSHDINEVTDRLIEEYVASGPTTEPPALRWNARSAT